MSARTDCGTIERLAGAIAIGEAGDLERETYRSHLAGCARCLNELGGEREIERVMLGIARARDDERWEPDLRAAFARKTSRRFGWTAVAALAAAIAVVVGVRAIEQPQPAPVAQRSVPAQEARAIAALSTQTVPHREGRAESLALGAPATLAATLRVNVNARGIPVGCSVAKSSGNATLDESICRAAMRAHYKLNAPAH